eukprot:3235526-Alexandrium_andersonii.AAC.1
MVRLDSSDRIACPLCEMLWHRSCQTGILDELTRSSDDTDVLVQAVCQAAVDGDDVLGKLSKLGKRVLADEFGGTVCHALNGACVWKCDRC